MRDLGKWPRLLVRGEPISHTLANEVLLRTNYWEMYTNDREWRRELNRLTGVELDVHGPEAFEALRRFEAELDVLELSYLQNSRIASTWIGGSKGWCDWDGNVGCSTWNVGKWPSAEEVTADWEAIAAAFPFLTLRAQLVPDEGKAGEPAVEWAVAGGAVTVNEAPTELLRAVDEPTWFSVLEPGGERGVSLVRLDVALRQVRAGALARRGDEVLP